MPPELRVQMRKCFVNRKHCLSASFFRDSEPRRTLLSFPRSTEGNWIKEPEKRERERKERDREREGRERDREGRERRGER